MYVMIAADPIPLLPGVSDDIPVIIDCTAFVNIMTSVTENWAKCNCLIARPALEITQDRLREVERNRLNRIREDGHLKSERLKHAIACLDVRELSGIEPQDRLSQPAELMG
jgi:hypothetical protein